MADNQRLPSQGICSGTSEIQNCFSHILGCSEFSIDSFLQHHCPDYVLFADAKRPCLFGNLLFHQGCTDEARTHNIATDIMLRTFLGDHFG